MFSSPARIISVIFTAAALTGCGSPSEITRSANVLQIPQAESLSVVARQFQTEAPHTIHFGFDEDWLDADAMARLNAQADWIIQNSNVKFRVYGHADRVGSTEYNVDLGLRRATAAVAYLVERGISENRLEAMVSLGEDAPVVETEDRERANRRVVTEVFGFLNPAASTVARNGITTISIGDPVPTGAPVPTGGPDDNGPTPPASGPTPSDPTPSDPSPKGNDKDKHDNNGRNPNSGRGNGDETGDPGNSEGRNNGGDEVKP